MKKIIEMLDNELGSELTILEEVKKSPYLHLRMFFISADVCSKIATKLRKNEEWKDKPILLEVSNPDENIPQFVFYGTGEQTAELKRRLDGYDSVGMWFNNIYGSAVKLSDIEQVIGLSYTVSISDKVFQFFAKIWKYVKRN